MRPLHYGYVDKLRGWALIIVLMPTPSDAFDHSDAEL